MRSEHWGELRGRRQWLVTPLTPTDPARLLSDLGAVGARILGHVPDSSWLVLGPTDLPTHLMSANVSVVSVWFEGVGWKLDRWPHCYGRAGLCLQLHTVAYHHDAFCGRVVMSFCFKYSIVLSCKDRLQTHAHV